MTLLQRLRAAWDRLVAPTLAPERYPVDEDREEIERWKARLRKAGIRYDA